MHRYIKIRAFSLVIATTVAAYTVYQYCLPEILNFREENTRHLEEGLFVGIQKPAADNINNECVAAIGHIQLSNITEKGLSNLFKTCLPGYELKQGIDLESFNGVFKNTLFWPINCSAPVIGFSKTPTEKVALASFPGSGNTWVRHLLEQLTGIYTGSIYDGVVKDVFKGENACPGDDGVYIIKTHLVNDRAIKKRVIGYCPSVAYTKAIIILRNPFAAILANYNRIRSGKTKVPSFSSFNGSGWNHFVYKFADKWYRHSTYWLTTFTRPAHVLVYERLQENIAWEMYNVFKFLHYPITFQSLWCASVNSEGQYHRKKPDWMTTTRLYTKDLIITVNNKIKKLENILSDKEINLTITKGYTLPI